MSATSPGDQHGRLLENLMHFARVLRTLGFTIGTDRVSEAASALQATGIERRDDFYWTLHALFVSHPRQRELFDQAFHVFWQNPRLLERAMSLTLPHQPSADRSQPIEKINRRVSEVLFNALRIPGVEITSLNKRDPVANASWSQDERLKQLDFDAMSQAEVNAAKSVIANLRFVTRHIRTRRFKASHRGMLVDLRATLRESVKYSGDVALQRRRHRTRPPALVVLCDISGSMSQYSRMVLHFLHALSASRARVHSFVFGTRLNNISHQLRTKDVDAALGKVADAVTDWHGGTRIGYCLRQFNRLWSRRLLAQGAVVLLISDGLDRDAGSGLAAEMARLARSCRQLVWLNPLLRYANYEPLALGAKAMLPHVDDFRTIHNLNSMADLAAALAAHGASQGPRSHNQRRNLAADQSAVA